MLNHAITDLVGLVRIILLDITLAADNAIAIGMAINSLPVFQQKKALFWGLSAAALIRIFLAIIVQYLLKIPGLNLLGGLMLLYVCWEMYEGTKKDKEKVAADSSHSPRTLKKAIISIIIADISMSLDNVLGIAGAAENNIWLMVGGIAIAVMLMGMAATFIARLLKRFVWLVWIGMLIILSVALELAFKGGHQLYILFLSSHFFH